MKTRKSIFNIIFILLVLLPWLNNDNQDNFSIPKVSQENNSFYEINPCKISLVQFLVSNSESIYQNHYYFRSDNRSSIKCFGRVTGVTSLQRGLETQFFISIGTNSLINLLIQGFFWIFLVSLIPKSSNTHKNISNHNKFENISIILISYYFSYSIYAESRFYETNLYNLDLDQLRSFFLIFLIKLLITKNLIDVFINRDKNIINYLPFIYICTFIFSGFNFSLLASIFLYYGLLSYLNGENKSKFSYLYILLGIWWLINSTGSFYFNVGKLRGFTSSVYEFNANLYWVLFLLFILKGIYKFYVDNREYFIVERFIKNLSITSFSLLLIGLISSNIPIFNFFSYYFLGLQRNGVESNNPFAFDEFGVKISWRGLFPSSETVGEFYGLVLLFLLFWISKSKKISLLHYLGIFSSSLGLYFSDNKTSIVLVFLIIVYYFYLNYFSRIINKKILIAFMFATLIVSILFYFKGDTYEFTSISIYSQSVVFQYDSIFSSYLKAIINFQETKTISSYLFGFFSTLAFFLNRSEMWGLFFARYNPTFMELLFGSGPLNFGQLYGEIVINNPDSLLLPHSSFLSLLLFIGVIPIFFLVIKMIYLLIRNKTNYEFIIISFYLLINIFKNDSINYLVPFIFYIFIFLILKNKKNLFELK